MVERLFDRPALRTRPRPGYHPFEIHAGAFSAAHCERVIADAESGGLEGASLETPAGDDVSDAAIRRSKTSWLAPDDTNWWIYERLARVVEQANRRYGFELGGFDEDLQYTVYDEPGSFYTWHQDGLDSTVAHRKLSIVVQLSDPSEYEGAALQFFEVADDYDAVQRGAFEHDSSVRGTAVVFPSFEYHRVLPLIRGVRRSLVAWVSGPPFR